MAESAYDLLKKSYEKQQAAINAQQQQQTQEKADREALAKKTLEANNRGVYTTYKNAINPYGAVASQGNMATGTSEYMKNAAYGTMLQGLGANQANYNTEMTNSNSLWQQYLADKAQQEADMEADYTNALIAQQNNDKALASSYSSGGGTNEEPYTPPVTNGKQSTESIDKYLNKGYTGSTASEKGFSGEDYTSKAYTYTTNETLNGVKYRVTYSVTPGGERTRINMTPIK